ncbi:hypothetical protein GCM10007916_28910 [Psychromonas marina]|uniref:Uncharacterized protein n=1 Tax=Psychromonas marina TaxID=88364 RepID=A0ABQ6E3A4_9GAMM|nr:hypothetical protein GCM10007916_28910 [Psychromonas marina]
MHAGKSTGAKSKDGKLVVSKNAITNYGSWLFNQNIKTDTEYAVDYVFQKVMELNSKLIDE